MPSVKQEMPSHSGAPFPVRLTSFVGRSAELGGVREALGHHRLVSLVGPGGVGKTRLAVEAARPWRDEPAWYVDLAPVEDDAAVEPALAVATGAPEGPGEDPLDATVRRLGETVGLVLVDNCDLVVDACAKAIDVLLRSCPGLTVLATSREPLRVEGELVVRVPSMSLPSNEDQVDGDAVELFLDRARLSPERSQRDRGSIREICRRLDGAPLAIELAAARASALSVADILTGLDNRFVLLADGPRTADRRQQSLVASIEWSHRLLGTHEAVALRRLAVFRGPFTAEAATAVVADGWIAESEVLPLLTRLVEKSFVVVDERDETSRHRLLGTIREYAAERLEADRSDATATRDRHLRNLRETAERFEPVFRRQSPREWLDRLESVLPDIRAAVSWAAETGNADDALRLVGSLSRFWWVRARADGDRTLEQALAIDGGEPCWRAHALTAAARAAIARFDSKALSLGRAAVDWADQSGDSGMVARAHCELGWIYLSSDLARARPHLVRAAELAHDCDDPWTEAAVLNGLVAAEIGYDLPAAKAKADQALDLASRHDDRIETCGALVWRNTVAFAQGRLIEVQDYADRALPLAAAIGAAVRATNTRADLAHCAALRGDDATAGRYLDAMDATADECGAPIFLAYAAAVRAVVFGTPGQIEAARASLADALPAVPPFRFGMYVALMSDILTDAALGSGDVRRARAYVAEAAAFAEDAEIGWARSRALLAAARVKAYTREVQAARGDVHRALADAGSNDDLMTAVESLELLAGLEVTQRSPETAVRLVAAAAAERSRIGYLRPLVGKASLHALLDELRDELGTAAFEAGWAEGDQMSLANAVALARRGRGRRRRPATGWDALTPTERRVVGLVEEGLTNPQVAARLFVSPDTVKGHVSAAFRKLGVANRAELAAEAARRADAG